MALAIRISRDAHPHRCRNARTATSPSTRDRHSARSSRSSACGGPNEACDLPHIPPLLRDASNRGRLRHPHGSGATRAH
jgi:hypothetical protein